MRKQLGDLFTSQAPASPRGRSEPTLISMMRSFSLFLALLFTLTASVYAWPGTNFPTLEVRHYGNSNSNKTANATERAIKKSCRRIRRLNALSQIASNQTKFDIWVSEGRLDTTQVDFLKAKAANATVELETLQSNATLVAECAVVNAERRSVWQCRKMKRLAKLAALAGNETALAAFGEKKGLNETGVERLKEKIARAQTKLQQMRANITLMNFCAQRQQQKDSDGDGSDSDDTIADPAQQTTGGAAELTAKTMPFVLVPALAAMFMLFL